MLNRKTALAAALALASGPALAVPFSPLDARALAMGGTGVAGARPAAAGLFNPALLAAQNQDADFSLVLPSVGVVLDDQDNLVDTVDEIQSGSLNQVEDGIDRVNEGGGSNAADVQALGVAAGALARDLPRLGNKPVNLEIGASLGFGVPSRTLGFGLYAAGNLSAGIQAEASAADSVLLDRLATYAQDGTFDAAERADTTLFQNGGANIRDLEDVLTSTVSVVGVVIGEVGVPLAREFAFGDQSLSLGITPKMVTVDTIHYRAVINSEEELGDVIDDSRYRREYSDINFDLGAARVFGDAKRPLTVGLVVRNLITQNYATAPDASGKTYAISLEPQVRAGLEKRWGMFGAALDLDLTKNQSVGLGEDSQFLGIGVEFDARYVALRAGYRHNLVSDGIQDMATAGLGLGPLDLSAVYADEHSLGAVLQLGFSF
jgi:hypothetical protein